tara:strand:- start:1025 stop:1807 length:783 start_codon:yes stop_codon:yes gene_type:complete
MITITNTDKSTINTTPTVLEKLCKCKENYFMVNHKIIKGADVLECTNYSDTSNEISNDTSITSKYKILCLHGGGMTGESFQYLMKDYITELSSTYEFYFPSANDFADGVWVEDPPLGKDTPTTESNWAKSSVDKLDTYRQKYGPFKGILGYSQGAMFATYYLTQVPLGTFDFAVLFCGYKPLTHLGLLETINDNKNKQTFSLNTLVYSGELDYIISNELTDDLALLFNNLTRIHSPTMGHSLPVLYSSEYNKIIEFMLAQ